MLCPFLVFIMINVLINFVFVIDWAFYGFNMRSRDCKSYYPNKQLLIKLHCPSVCLLCVCPSVTMLYLMNHESLIVEMFTNVVFLLHGDKYKKNNKIYGTPFPFCFLLIFVYINDGNR